MTIGEMREKLKRNLDEQRFLHSLGVMETSDKLAKLYGACRKKTQIASLLHDCARGMDMERQLNMIEYFGILLDDVEKRERVLIHGPLGAIIAEKDYGIIDDEIKNAIKIHSTGDAHMGLLAKIIFISDIIESGRSFPGVEDLRIKALKDLDGAIIDAFDMTIKYVLSKRSLLHPKTVKGRNFILTQREREGRA